ncbi:MAG: hypothetical protein Q7J15_11880 [Candidatus Desulfaltia sp.]|nr:hypothetical protein [Candidatus Desulfaltia sp.]
MSPPVAIKKIGIIGGGIGGLFLTSSIVQCWDNYPDIYIFDPRFDKRGETRTSRTSGLVYQGWAGSFGLPLIDPSIIAHKIDTITFHKDAKSVETSDPLGRKICIINRNPVQRNGRLIPSIYQHIQSRISNYKRIHFLPFRVNDIYFPKDFDRNFTIVCDDYDGTTHQINVDGVVFTTLPPKIKKTLSREIGYRPPKKWPGAIFDVYLKRGKWLPKYQTLHKFFVGGGRIHTIDLIPRRDTLTVMALGKGATLPVLFEHIDNNPNIQRCLPENWRSRIVEGSACSLNVPVTSAKNAVSDGIACLGGHLFGALLINGGLYTNLWAAELLANAVKERGFHKDGLEKLYFAKLKKTLYFQNLIGKTIYMLTDNFLLPSKSISYFFLREFIKEKELIPEKRILTRFAWDILIGKEPFSHTTARALKGLIQKICGNDR